MILNDIQIHALSVLIDYVIDSEKTHFIEYVESGGSPDNHIYDKAIILSKLFDGV